MEAPAARTAPAGGSRNREVSGSMSFQSLQREAFQLNQAIYEHGLALLTWGNASLHDRDRGVMAIKPSGVSAARLKEEDIVVLSIEDGRTLAGALRPSSDTPTHLYLYRAFAGVGAIIHTHSTHATAWAQAGQAIPCFGTTHADHFNGAVPVTRPMRPDEIQHDYEENTGRVIAECFATHALDAGQMPGVLVHGHGPFAWGEDGRHALDNAVALEEIARLAWYTRAINPAASPIAPYLLEKHFTRKHGPAAYYGQATGGARDS